MKITLYQDVIAWSDKQANFNRINQQLEALQGKPIGGVARNVFNRFLHRSPRFGRRRKRGNSSKAH